MVNLRHRRAKRGHIGRLGAEGVGGDVDGKIKAMLSWSSFARLINGL
jgi:hypothetical protein